MFSRSRILAPPRIQRCRVKWTTRELYRLPLLQLLARGVAMTGLVESLDPEWPVAASTEERDPMRVTLPAVQMLYEATGQQQGKGIRE